MNSHPPKCRIQPFTTQYNLGMDTGSVLCLMLLGLQDKMQSHGEAAEGAFPRKVCRPDRATLQSALETAQEEF